MIRPLGHPWFLWLCSGIPFYVFLWLYVVVSLNSYGLSPVTVRFIIPSIDQCFGGLMVMNLGTINVFRNLGCTKRYGLWFLHLFTLIGPPTKCKPWKLSTLGFWLARGWFSVLTLIGFSIMSVPCYRHYGSRCVWEREDHHAKSDNSPGTSTGKTRGRKSNYRIIDEAAIAYHAGSTSVHQLIAQWEEDINKQAKFQDIDVEEWKTLVPDPEHSRDCTSQYKQTVHLYLLMKILLGKTLEHIPSSSATTTLTFPDYSQEFQQIKF